MLAKVAGRRSRFRQRSIACQVDSRNSNRRQLIESAFVSIPYEEATNPQAVQDGSSWRAMSGRLAYVAAVPVAMLGWLRSRQQHAGDTLIRILIRRKQEDGPWSTYRALEG